MLWPPHLMATQPGINIIGASHTSELAQYMSSKVQSYIRGNEGLLGYELESENVNSWMTTNDSEYRAAGVGGSITGRRADIGIIDDPMKGRKEADSLERRNTVWDWYHGDFWSRLKPNASVVLIMTRWHEDDLGGRLLKAQPGSWRVVCVRAQCEDEDDPLGRQIGEYLWDNDPNYAFGDQLRKTKRNYEETGKTREWSALYQQRPAPPEGIMFKVGHIRPAEVSELGYIEWVRAWDLAGTEKKASNDPSFTVGVKLGKTPSGSFVVGDVVRFRGAPEDVERTIKQVAQTDGYMVRVGLPQDPGQAGKFQVANYGAALAGFTVEATPESGSKIVRANGIAAQCNIGNLAVANTAVWDYESFKEELASFPAGEHDDQVDALSRAFNMLINADLAMWTALGARP
jgi:predicted phage terminase large subunit-like protein